MTTKTAEQRIGEIVLRAMRGIKTREGHGLVIVKRALVPRVGKDDPNVLATSDEIRLADAILFVSVDGEKIVVAKDRYGKGCSFPVEDEDPQTERGRG